MAISPNLREYLRGRGTTYDEIPHARTFTSSEAAHAAHISGNHLAKGVMLGAGDRYVLAVLPASKKVDISQLRTWLGRDVRLLSEAEAAMNFPDCEFGAIPALGAAYGLEVIVDDDLIADDMSDDEEIFFEGGDHRTLVAIEAADWRRMIRGTRHCPFGMQN